jgi:hypothetical protein
VNVLHLRHLGLVLLLVVACTGLRDPDPPYNPPWELADASVNEFLEVEYSVGGAATVLASLQIPAHTGLMGFWARYERDGSVCRMLEAHLQGVRPAPRVAVRLGGLGAWPTTLGPHELNVSLTLPEACTDGGS